MILPICVEAEAVEYRVTDTDHQGSDPRPTLAVCDTWGHHIIPHALISSPVKWRF